MDVNSFVNGIMMEKKLDSINSTLKDNKTTLNLQILKNIAIEGFNEGVLSVTSKKAISSTTAASEDVTDKTPEAFVLTDSALVLYNSILKIIESNSKNGKLNIGYEDAIKEAVMYVLKNTYSIGIDNGFSIATNAKEKEMFINNHDQFIVSNE